MALNAKSIAHKDMAAAHMCGLANLAWTMQAGERPKKIVAQAATSGPASLREIEKTAHAAARSPTTLQTRKAV